MSRKRDMLPVPVFRALVDREFAPDLNAGIDPATLSRSTRTSCFWRHTAPDGTPHVWRTNPRERALGSRCPHCQNRSVRDVPLPMNLSVAGDARLAAEWDPEANGVDPASVSAHSTRPYCWKCPVDGNRWQQSPYLRTTRGYGCPACAGHVVLPEQSLRAWIERNPGLGHLGEEWDPSVPQPDLEQVVPTSSLRLHWVCRRPTCGHRWVATVASRADRGTGCPRCARRVASPDHNLATVAPELTSEWHPTLNGSLRPQDLLPNSGRKVWWWCRVHDHHEWRQSPAIRLRNPRCPFCTGQRTHGKESLASLHPELAAQWCPTLNEPLSPDQVRPGSNRKVWWTCGVAGHDPWRTSPCERTASGSGCPQCSGRRASPTNNLHRHIKVNPHLTHLLEEWDDTANAASGYVMEKLTPSSHTRVAWVCREPSCGHRWKSAPHVRVRGIGCPKCDANCYATSRTEIHLRNELAWVFGAGEVREGKGFAMASGKLRKADIVIETLRLVVEYDGAYFHSEQLRPGRTASDRAKTQALREAGFQVIRVREAPLEALDPAWDVVVRSPKSNWNIPNFHCWLKEVADQVLGRIRQRLSLGSEHWAAIVIYQNLTAIQAAEAAQEETRRRSVA